jgi:hypothetical protein
LATSFDEPDPENLTEADEYEVLRDQDVDDEPPTYRPLGPGDVFSAVALDHLAEPFNGAVMVVGHPCSLRRGLVLQADVPVAPIVEQGVPTRQHASTDRLLPVRKLLPPRSEKHHVVDLTLATTIPADRLDMTQRCACLSNAGIVALQQRLVGNLVRVKVPAGVITKHCRGPLTELELWTDWRAEIVNAGFDAASRDKEFDEFMQQPSGFGTLPWRDAIAEHEHARGSAVTAMENLLADLLQGDTAESSQQ